VNLALPDIAIPPDLERDEMPDLLRHWYLGPRARRHMMMRRFAEVDRHLDPAGGRRVLDVGSAWGFNVLRPGGRLVLSTPNHASTVERAKRVAVRHRWIRAKLPSMCYPDVGATRADYHPYRYHRPWPDREIVSLLTSAGFHVTGVSHFLFMLKSTPDALYAPWSALERLGERTPLVRRSAATVCVVASKPS